MLDPRVRHCPFCGGAAVLLGDISGVPTGFRCVECGQGFQVFTHLNDTYPKDAGELSLGLERALERKRQPWPPGWTPGSNQLRPESPAGARSAQAGRAEVQAKDVRVGDHVALGPRGPAWRVTKVWRSPPRQIVSIRFDTGLVSSLAPDAQLVREGS